MRARSTVATALGAILVVLAGCTPVAGVPSPTTTPTTSVSGGTSTLGTVAPPPPSEPPDDNGVTEYEVTYGFAVPSTTIRVTNPGSSSVFPTLVGIYAADHPEGDPAYQRISFYFRGGLPSYRFRYAPLILEDATGDPVQVIGDYFLEIVFEHAYAHSLETGASTVVETPPRPMAFSRLFDYTSAGDYEGQVTYGLGINGASRAAIRSGELKRSDGAGGSFFVVFVDVRTA